MRHEVPLQTMNGSPAPGSLEMEAQGPLVRLGLSADLVGRDVDEEIDRSALEALLSGGPQRNYDLLGLSFETDGGDTILVTVGVGSGNERFLMRRADLIKSLSL